MEDKLASLEQALSQDINALGLSKPVSLQDLTAALHLKDQAATTDQSLSEFLQRAPATLIIRTYRASEQDSTETDALVGAVMTLAKRVQCPRLATLEVELRRALVPADFPIVAAHSSLAGAQPKLALVEFGGRYYQPGASPPEVLNRWEVCEDLARQLAERSLETEKGKYAHLSREAILEQYLQRLFRTGWGADEEMKWVVHRTAAMLKWPVPKEAQFTPQ
ncbi:hypothetical protein SAMN05192549_12326 [Duganella sacchari]|jgi:hypothetical protein|uniref:Uncharacterized protein n=1 Tax=Duganella sacchari TaxID=551987 RepID=A0A1M7RE77_9BURK|nr:hypothetical protein [Duganella sacchari]SHN44617.1 hypothetical protein SAMN05192549_12326 [Duganella sacchari]